MPAHVFNLGSWEPDKAAIEIDGVAEALNCVPGPSGYGPFRELVTVTTALDAYPRGAVQLRDDSDAVLQYCGDETKLYINVGDAWTDASLQAGTAIELTGVGTNIGDMTGDGGLVAAFDDDTTQNVSLCATAASATSAWVGKTLAAASQIHRVVVHGSDDAGFVSGANPSVTLTMYGKEGTVPANSTDGTVIGTLAAFTDTADESAGRTITCTDRETEWDHVWVKIDHDGSTATMSVAELIFQSPDRYDTAVGDAWEFAKWRNTVIATNYTNNPQTLTLGSTAFADLTTAVKFKHVAVIRDFVVGGYTNDSVDNEVPWRVRWCAFQDPTDWTVDPSTLADYEDLPQRKIQRIFGGEYGIIFQDESITRMTFVGAPLVFQFDEIVPGLGLIAPGAAVRANDIIFFLSSRGFYALANGSQVQPIGLDRVDDFVLADLDRSSLNRISSAADPANQRVFWSYPGGGSDGGTPNKIICFDYGRGRWSHIDQACDLLWEASGSAVTLEGLDSLYADLDVIPISLDSPTLIGGQRTLAGFFTDYKSGFFNGEERTATIVTREYMFDGDRRTRVGGFRPMVEGDAVSITARIGTRNDIAEAVIWSDILTPRTGGRVVCRTNGRYHRVELNVGGTWSKAFGVIVDKRDVGSGGRRG